MVTSNVIVPSSTPEIHEVVSSCSTDGHIYGQFSFESFDRFTPILLHDIKRKIKIEDMLNTQYSCQHFQIGVLKVFGIILLSNQI